MEARALTTTDTRQATLALLMPATPSKDQKSRIRRFARWLDDQEADPLAPDLAAYRDHLLDQDYKNSSVSGYLSTIRARYRDLLTDNELRDDLRERARAALEARGERATAADVKAMVDEAMLRLRNGIDPQRSEVKTEKVQDRIDADYGTRLTKEQASVLIGSPGIDTLAGLRDTALLALALCTGAREQELCNVEVRDLRQAINGELCLHIREGKGCKTRAIPYGAGVWCLAIVDKWLEAAHIEKGPVFRSFYKGNRRMRRGHMSTRAVELIVGGYPVMIDGKLASIAPHDLRRTYARRCYDEGMDIVAIQQNLGHADLQTTLRYIGVLDATKRRPPALYSFDLAALERVTVQGLLDLEE